jgi:hypothetical protein
MALFLALIGFELGLFLHVGEAVYRLSADKHGGIIPYSRSKVKFLEAVLGKGRAISLSLVVGVSNLLRWDGWLSWGVLCFWCFFHKGCAISLSCTGEGWAVRRVGGLGLLSARLRRRWKKS